MSASLLPLALLASTALTAATVIGPWFLTWQGGNARTDSVLQTVLGDARRLFGEHFYAKADAYFHQGYYPTMFDGQEGPRESHLTAKATGAEAASGDFLGQSRDWIEAFGRHFFPSQHAHLGNGHGNCDHDHDHDHEHGPGHHDCDQHPAPSSAAAHRQADEREMLPWLKLSAALDPHRIETYVVTAYWLRTALHQVNEAEQFLRHGLRENPGDCEILFELGRIQAEDRQDPGRARNIWELALRNWDRMEPPRQEAKAFLRAQILGQLAKLEEAAGQPARAIEHLIVLRSFSPNPQSIQKWIDGLQAKAAVQPPVPPAAPPR